MMKHSRRYAFFLLTVLLVFPAAMPMLHARSWQEIKKSGVLKILTSRADNGNGGLHRVMMPIDREQAFLRRFATRHGLKAEYLPVDDFAAIFSQLDAGRGDLAAAGIAATPERRKKYLLSAPFDYTREIVFGSEKNFGQDRSVKALVGKKGAILPGTTYLENFRNFTAGIGKIDYCVLPHSIAHDELIARVVSGEIAYSVLNECDLDAWSIYQTGIRRLFVLRNNVELVFAARRDAAELTGHLDRFLAEFKIAPSPATASLTLDDETGDSLTSTTEDLDAIKKRGYIRMLTSNDVFNCYLDRGAVRGFEYELARRFADKLDVAVVTVIPADFEDLPKLLAEGKGDFIAANFTVTPERLHALKDLTFCAPYGEVSQVLVGRPDAAVTGIADLAGKTIYARKGKVHYDTLRKLQLTGVKLTIAPIEDDNSDLFALRQISDGKIDYAVVDDTHCRVALNQGFRIKKLLTLSPVQQFAWVVRKNNPQLAAGINAFFKKENKSAFYNLCKKRYYDAPQKMPTVRREKSSDNFHLSPYDDLFRKYGELYHFHWFFLAAQAYQESRFNTNLVNGIGAAGLMQVMPDTAKMLGASRLTDPDHGIAAGAKYMAQLRQHFPDAATPEDALCFTLASYNAGYGHILDARKLAKERDLDPRIWFNHTEKALELLQYKKYASRAKYGYCRAPETISYVRNIILQAHLYWEMLEMEKLRRAGENKN